MSSWYGVRTCVLGEFPFIPLSLYARKGLREEEKRRGLSLRDKEMVWVEDVCRGVSIHPYFPLC